MADFDLDGFLATPEPQQQAAQEFDLDGFMATPEPQAVASAPPQAAPVAARSQQSDFDLDEFLATPDKPQRPPSAQAQSLERRMGRESEQPEAQQEPLPTGGGTIAKEFAQEAGTRLFVPPAKAGASAIEGIGGLIDFMSGLNPVSVPLAASGNFPAALAAKALRPDLRFGPGIKIGKAIAKFGKESGDILDVISPSQKVVTRDKNGKRKLRFKPLRSAKFWTDSLLQTFTSISINRSAAKFAGKTQAAKSIKNFGNIIGGALGSVQEAGPMFERLQEEGMSREEAALRSAAFGTVVAVLEKFGLDKLFGAKGKGAKVIGVLAETIGEAAEDPSAALIANLAREGVTVKALTKKVLGAAVDSIDTIIPTLLTAGLIAGGDVSSRSDTATPITAQQETVQPPSVPTQEPPPIPIQAGESAPVTAARVAALEAGRQEDAPVTAAEVVSADAAGVPITRLQKATAQRDIEARQGNAPQTDATQAVSEKRSNPALDGATGQTQPRKFAERVASTDEIDPAIREGLTDPDYVPISNDVTLQEADAIVQSKGTDSAARLVRDESNAMTPRVRNVIAQRLIRQHSAEATALKESGDPSAANESVAKAVDVADHISEWGTRMGQGIQAFAIWNRLDSAAVLVKAQRTIKKRNKGKPKSQQVEMTPKQAARIQELADKAQAAPEGFQQNEKIVEMMTEIDKIAGKPSKGDVAASLWYANILSGFSTHQRNIIDTAINTVFDVTATAAANKQNPLRALGTLIRGTISRGAPEAAGVLQTGVPTVRVDTKVEGATALESNPFTGLLKPLNAWKHVARSMQAEDSLFFKGAQEAKAEILARNIAKKEGLRGKALTTRAASILGNTQEQLAQFGTQADKEGLKGLRKRRRVNELMEQNRPEDLLENSTAFAGRATYNYNPEGTLGIIARKVGEITRDIPALKIVVPFTRIVANVTNRSIDYTPWGFKRAFLGQTQEATARQKELKAERVAKAAVGSLAMAAVYAMDAMGDDDDPNSFMITSRGPSDRKARNQLRETGWKPYSVRVNGTYYSYMLTPMAIPFAFIGSVRDAERYNKLDQKDLITRIEMGAVLAGQSILNQSFLSGVADVMDIFGGQGGAGQTKALQRFFGRAAGGVIPNLVRQIDRVFDPTVMENRTIQEALWREIPFARRSGKPKINMLGEAIKSPQALIVSQKRSDKVWNLIAEKEAWIPIPSRQTQIRIGKEGRFMEPNEYYDYIQISGKDMRRKLEKSFERLRGMKKDQAQQWVKQQTSISRKRAKRQIEQAARIK